MIIVTNTKFDSGNKVNDIRRKLTLRMFNLASSFGYKIFNIDDNSDDEFLENADRLGVSVRKQRKEGMGNARREAISFALENNPSDSFIVWIEPEKCNMITHLRLVEEIEQSNANELVLFLRKSLDSYPREQQLSYSFGKVLSEYIFGQMLDLFFGPVAFRRSAVDYFLKYLGDYGDKWDSIHIPKIRIISNNIPFHQITIDYSHPFEQTSAEIGDLDIFIKRAEQSYNLSLAYIDESRKLKLDKKYII